MSAVRNGFKSQPLTPNSHSYWNGENKVLGIMPDSAFLAREKSYHCYKKTRQKILNIKKLERFVIFGFWRIKSMHFKDFRIFFGYFFFIFNISIFNIFTFQHFRFFEDLGLEATHEKHTKNINLEKNSPEMNVSERDLIWK